ncbi:MAG: type II toxin-antitoxin system RelE/ParE family toxin [Oscillospiraceae bacterium]|jgi:mRNA interferase RelE/StbE|nr:type II toxin-antitoxin system RelE/ParE family toxin [Oscillospiraceae bacterium]
MKIQIDHDAEKYLTRLNSETKERIRLAISGIMKTPPEGDIKPLRGKLNGKHRLRVGNLRIIYARSPEQLEIIKILPRGDAYK